MHHINNNINSRKNKGLTKRCKKNKIFCKNVLTMEKVCNIKRVTGREVGQQDRKVLCGAKASGYKTSE